MNKKLLLTGFLAIILSSCGPMYDTSYAYTAPKTRMAKLCSQSCNNSSSNCSAQCSNNRNFCDTKKDLINTINHLVDDKKKSRYHSDRCGSDYDACKNTCVQEFNRCFESCGGKVTTHKSHV